MTKHKFTYTNKERTEAVYRGQKIRVVKQFKHIGRCGNHTYKYSYFPSNDTQNPLFTYETKRKNVVWRIDTKLDK